MFGIKFIKASATDYIILYRKGKVVLEGVGLSFFYYAPSSNLVLVPVASIDSPFIFKETSSDYQEINIQGQFTFRVLDPKKLSSILNFSIDTNSVATGDGKEILPSRITSLIQVALREKLSSKDLRTALKSGQEFVEHVKSKMKTEESILSMGIEIMDFSVLKISPTPEVSRALEASAREGLFKEADEAIYQRRNFAVEQERKIKENELQTQISIEEKNKKIREEQMNIEIAVQEKKSLLEESKLNSVKLLAEKQSEIERLKLESQISLEEKKKKFFEHQSSNLLAISKTKGEALKFELSAFNTLSPEVIEILSLNQMNSNQIISRAMRDLSKNAGKIGNLNISPELLNSLLEQQKNV